MFAFKKRASTAVSLMKKAPIKIPPKKVCLRAYRVPKGRWIRDELLCADGKSASAMLAARGVAIIPGVMDPSLCPATFDAVMRDMETIVPSFKYDIPSTWPNLRRDGKALHTMIFQHFGVAWLQSVVNARQNPQISQIFADIFSDLDSTQYLPRDMLMSADGICAYINSSKSLSGYYQDGHDNLHTDQEATNEINCVQGFINIVNSRYEGVSRNACLEVVLQSHLFSKQYAERFPETKNNRFNLIQNQQQMDFLRTECGCEVVHIDALAGDLVLWHHHTFHQAKEAERPKYSQGEDVAVKRMTIYVSLQPYIYAQTKDILKKRKAFDSLDSTDHNASRGVSTFPRWPRNYGHALIAQGLTTRPILNDQGKRQWALPIMTKKK